MADVSYFRPAGTAERPPQRGFRRTVAPGRRSPRGRYIGGGILLLALGLVAAAALLFVSAKASLNADPNALASVGMPLGGGKIESVSVTAGPHSRQVPVQLRGDQIWPTKLIAAHQVVAIDVVVKRPGWISWLAGKTQRLHLQLTTPSASLRSHFLTLKPRAPIKLSFKQPIRVISFGQYGHMQRRVLSKPRSVITLARPATAGSFNVAAAPRSWESAKSSVVSWFPAGAGASAVASPTPGSKIRPNTPISLTFNKTVAQALGSNRPPVSPTTAGSWHTTGSHTIVFRPTGYGYGLGSTVKVGLPSDVRLVDGGSRGGTWTVPSGSPQRLQQLLSLLGYLPFKFHYANGRGVGLSPQAQLSAAIHPPAGHFIWRYHDVPSTLRDMWRPGSYGTMSEGALMAFENDHGLATVGLSNPLAWKYLIQATVAGKRSTFGYSFVSVSLSGQHLSLWHNGHSILTTPVNTGIASRPTAPGTFPVYEHIRVGTMSGTNPDGSHYNDPGIQFISYFNGGDALHAFTRAQYGFPQSLGCVEMSLGPAGQVWPYTPIGTLVHVA